MMNKYLLDYLNIKYVLYLLNKEVEDKKTLTRRASYLQEYFDGIE